VIGASYIHSMNAVVKGTLQSYLQDTTRQTVPGLAQPMDARTNFALPSTARLGSEYRFSDGKAVLKAQLDWSHWSEFKVQDVIITPPAGVSLQLNQAYQRNYKDSWGARVGGSYFVLDPLELLLAVGFDTAAIPNAGMTPEINDAALLGFSIGPKLFLGKGPGNYLNKPDKRTGLFGKHDMIILHALWNPLIFQSRDVTGSAFLPATNGHYTTIIHMFDFNVDYRF
jgi:hypothetical protein